jgi:anaerobic magnesium-protoporphyrin IX monomethyl ester cyclase
VLLTYVTKCRNVKSICRGIVEHELTGSQRNLAKLRSTNCQLIHFGVESGSQKMLKVMRKGTTVELNAKAIKWAKEAGISVAVSLVIGYPGETPEMLQ